MENFITLVEPYIMWWVIANTMYWFFAFLLTGCNDFTGECNTPSLSHNIRETFEHLTTFGKFIFYPVYYLVIALEIGGFISTAMLLGLYAIVNYESFMVGAAAGLGLLLLLRLSFKDE